MSSSHTNVLISQCNDHVPVSMLNDASAAVNEPLLDALDPFTTRTQAKPTHPATQSSHQQVSYVRTLLQQLDAVGWTKVLKLSPDLRCLELQLSDAAGRRHQAEVQLPLGFPIAAPTASMQVPNPVKLRWLAGDSLVTLVSQLEKVLDAYQLLWEQLEDLDSHTQLLDPATALAKPYSHCSRCIALGNGASCQLKLSPSAPRALPSSVVFHGPSSVVAALQNSWYSSAHKLWQEQLSVRENLQAIIQVSLPPPKPGVRKGCAAVLAAAQGGDLLEDGSSSSLGSDAEDSDAMDEDAGACAICYALHLPDPTRPDEIGVAPSVNCPAALCGRPFHAACLAEWLGALPSSRRVFDTIFGTCPFCQGPIGVSTRTAS